MAEILWFVFGVMAVLAIAAILWACFLFVRNRVLKQQICGLMQDKGELSVRVSILEDAFKEKC